LLSSLAAQGRPNKQTAIDNYCQRLRAEFVEAQPDVFRGPNPWVQLEMPPGRVVEGSLALVYAEGSETRWVQLLIKGPHHEWFQTVNYFYGPDNRLVKRERYLEQVPANIALQEVLYYEDGAVFKKTSRHHSLKAGREDNAQFDDPNAPEFGSVEELPFPADSDSERPLAQTLPAVVAPFRAARASKRLLLPLTATQGLVEIPNQIFDIFQTDGKPHKFRTHPRRFLFRRS
jgi:hypothetical protein